MTGDEYLESVRDGREIWIYGERVKDVTTHPAFRNTVRMIARLYDALHDPARQAVLTTNTDTGGGSFTHKFFKASRTAEDLVGARDAIAEWARVSYGWIGRSPDYKAAFLATLGANADYYAPYDEQRAPLVQESPGRGLLRQPRHRQSAGRSRQAARRGERRLHARRERDRWRSDRERRQGRRDDLQPDALQLHRQQRRAADQDQAVRVRLHGADRRAGREAAVPAILRDDGCRDGHAVRLSALEPDGRERLDPDLRQGVRAVGERLRLRGHRQGQQLLPALRLSAAVHVPGVHATRREARLPGRTSAEGGRGHRRQGFSRRPGAGRRSAGVAELLLGLDRRDGAHDQPVDGRLRAARISTTGWRTA